ncbi:unnamed protein product [Caenorhabditis brenneri]
MKKLEQLCENVVLDGVVDGIYQNMALDTRMSNFLFKKFTDDYHFTEDVVNGFGQWHVTRFEVTEDRVTPVYGDFIRNSNNIEILDIPLKLLEKNYGSVVIAIRKLLNKSSQNSLKKLSLHGTHKYRINWNNMPPLPNLQYLNVEGCSINAFEEPKIVKLFPYLKELDISNSGLNSLKSIGELQNLEVLNIQDLQITDGLEEVFKLEKLRVLNMGSLILNSPKTARNYANLKKGLPELRYLDISFSSVTRELIPSLLENHPKLEILNLIGTKNELTYIPTTSKPQVLTIKTLENCAESLEFVIKKDCPKRVLDEIGYRILFRIFDILRDDDDDPPSEKTIRETGLQLCATMIKTRNSEKFLTECINTLIELFEDNRYEMFTEEDMKIIVKSLFTFHKTKPGRHNINGELWKFFSDDLILEQMNEETIDEICYLGAVSPADIYLIARAMFYCLDRASDKCHSELSKQYDFKFRILDAFETTDSRARKYFTMVVICELSNHVQEENLQLSRRQIEVIMREIKEFSDEEEYRHYLFGHLRTMVEKMDPRALEYFFSEVNVEIFRKLLMSKTADLSQKTIRLLILIVECSGKLPQFDEDESEDEKQRQISEFYDEHYDEHPFKVTDMVSYFRNLIFFSRASEYKYPEYFADIILDFIYEQQKVEGPSAKIQKLIIVE